MVGYLKSFFGPRKHNRDDNGECSEPTFYIPQHKYNPIYQTITKRFMGESIEIDEQTKFFIKDDKIYERVLTGPYSYKILSKNEADVIKKHLKLGNLYIERKFKQ